QQIPVSLFEDQVDRFFFNNSISEWTNVRTFCSDLLKQRYQISGKKAYQRYTKSLNTIQHKTIVDPRVREHAKDILRTRESSFRTDYFYIENLQHQDADGARKLSLLEDEEEPSHLALHFGLLTK
ncbi:hypothetical protein BGW38_005716, partial [Lunasporangiospora selenospora]